MIGKLVLLFTFSSAAIAQTAPARWSPEQANQWYEKQPWLVGANFIPSNAINELEMFQAATFDPAIFTPDAYTRHLVRRTEGQS